MSVSTPSVTKPPAASKAATPSSTLLRASREPISGRTPFISQLAPKQYPSTSSPPSTPALFQIQIHKHKLCTRIPFYSAMFNDSFKEATTDTAHLPDDDPAAFDVVMEWVYSCNRRLLRDMVSVTD
ncbi:hypothetical protein DL98DRAFT_658644, partial [Cadophora sp. DSE1049]